MKRAVVTAGTGGIGLETAIGLAATGHHVTVVGRNPERGRAAAERIGTATFVQADLSSLAEVRALAVRLAEDGPLDVLVNNVGAMFAERTETAEGIEATFAVNHLSPYVLTELLLDSLKGGRIVNVTSGAVVFAKRVFDEVTPPGGYYGFLWYGRAKLANLAYTLHLAERLRGTGISVFAADPGGAATTMTDGTMRSPTIVSPPLRLLWPLVRRTFERSTSGPASTAARSSLFAATDPGLEGATGLLIGSKGRTGAGLSAEPGPAHGPRGPGPQRALPPQLTRSRFTASTTGAAPSSAATRADRARARCRKTGSVTAEVSAVASRSGVSRRNGIAAAATPSAVNRAAQNGWSCMTGTATAGTPARTPAPVVPPPQAWTRAAVRGNSQSCGTSPTASTSSDRRPRTPVCSTPRNPARLQAPAPPVPCTARAGCPTGCRTRRRPGRARRQEVAQLGVRLPVRRRDRPPVPGDLQPRPPVGRARQHQRAEPVEDRPAGALPALVEGTRGHRGQPQPGPRLRAQSAQQRPGGGHLERHPGRPAVPPPSERPGEHAQDRRKVPGGVDRLEVHAHARHAHRLGDVHTRRARHPEQEQVGLPLGERGQAVDELLAVPLVAADGETPGQQEERVAGNRQMVQPGVFHQVRVGFVGGDGDLVPGLA